VSLTRKNEVKGFVRASGKKLVNGAGEELILRGVGFGSWLLPEGYMWRFPKEGDRPRRIEAMIESLVGKEKAEQFWATYYNRYIAIEDIVKIKEEGFNSVRLPINARFLIAEEIVEDCGLHSYREDRLRLIDQMIDWCRENDLYVILDLHGAPGGQTGANIDDSKFDRPELFMNENYLRQTVDIWRMLADRYKDEWIVAGYDLLNEPLPQWFSSLNDKVMPLYQEIIKAIREVDQRHMIILEGVHWSTDWSIFEEAYAQNEIDDNVMLQFHKYWNNPDTESIAQYLNYRDRWNVPIFMGEGGENNKDWYTGAFRLFEDHDISWNFWTWKKLSTTNSPCSIHIPEGWGLLVDYLQGGIKPNAEVAERILWTYLDHIRLANCQYQPEVVCSLLRRAPVRIPAVFYSYKGEGISYGLASKNLRASSSCQFRISDCTVLGFVDSVRTTATFAHGGGEEWESDQWLYLELSSGDWFVYEFIGDARDSQGKLTVSFMLQAAQVNSCLEVALNGQVIDNINVVDENWKLYDGVKLGAEILEENSLMIRCTEGKLKIMWLALE